VLWVWSALKVCVVGFHQYRPVNDCPCGGTFHFNMRAEHERDCLKFLQVNFPRIRKEEMALRQKLSERDADLRRLKLDHAEREAQASIGHENLRICSRLLW